ncbi:hypothetical protein D3C86_1616590 [compost metagenome]
MRASTYSRVANTTAGSILSVMLPALVTIMFILTICVRPEPCDRIGLKLGAQLATATRSPSASYKPISRIHLPPSSAGMICSAMMTAGLAGSTLSWFSGRRRHSLISRFCRRSGTGSVPLASPTPMSVISQGRPSASALACLASPTWVRMAKN